MIHPDDDGTFTISSHAMWLPGIYDSERAARYAFRFSNETLQQLSDRICAVHGENRAITTDDLKAARATQAPPPPP
jgi:hypothetical protein